MNIKKFITAAILISAVSACPDSRVFSFLKTPRGAANIGGGGISFAAFPDGAPVFLNPAAQGLAENSGFLVAHMELFGARGIQPKNDNLVSGVLKTDSSGVFGAGMIYRSDPGIELADEYGRRDPSAHFDASSHAVSISWAKKITKDLIGGAAVKGIREKIYTYRIYGAAVDAGIIYCFPIRGLRAGLSMHNAGTANDNTSSNNRNIQLPLGWNAGVNYTKGYSETIKISFRSGISSYSGTDPVIPAGIELKYKENLSLRLSSRINDVSVFSAGAGYTYRSILVNYAYTGFSEYFKGSNVFSISFLF